jgi:hypothetical protein
MVKLDVWRAALGTPAPTYSAEGHSMFALARAPSEEIRALAPREPELSLSKPE